MALIGNSFDGLPAPVWNGVGVIVKRLSAETESCSYDDFRKWKMYQAIGFSLSSSHIITPFSALRVILHCYLPYSSIVI